MTGERIQPIKPGDVKPLSPSEVAKEKLRLFPPQVLTSFNELIAEKYNPTSRESVVLQKDAVTKMLQGGLKQRDIYDKGWLDVEEIYRQAGWRVRYDKPVYYGGEDFEPYFTFSKASRRQR